MLNSFVKFPLTKNDTRPTLHLNSLQQTTIKKLLHKILTREYALILNPCLCRSDRLNDLILAENDRYEISVKNVLCKNCGIIRSQKILDPTSMNKFYKLEYRKIYVGEEECTEKFFLDQAFKGKRICRLIDNMHVLDQVFSIFEVGCGTGGILYPFWKKGKEVSGCDYDPDYLEYGQNQGMNLYEGGVDNSRTPEGSQDLVILSHVMEHFSDPIGSLSDVIKIVKPKGFLFIEVPGIFSIREKYFNPMAYFQNAHIYNFYKYYLEFFFSLFNLSVIYGDEFCSFILQKPVNWEKPQIERIYDEQMPSWAARIEKYIKSTYLETRLGLNPFKYKSDLLCLLTALGVKKFLFRIRGNR